MASFSPVIESSYGFRLAGKPADSSLNQIVFYRGLFEPSLSDLVCQLVEEGDICLDAGANVGYFSLLMASKVGSRGKVYAVEAAPGNIERLRRNVEINQFVERVVVRAVACAPTPGEVVFYVNQSNDMHSRLELPSKKELDYWLMSRRWQPTPVKALPLIDLVGSDASNIRFLKLDIEGSERYLAPVVVQSFTHPRLAVALEAKAPYIQETLQPFEAAGFHIYDLKNDYLWVAKQSYSPAVEISYAEAYAKKYMIDVLLTRHALTPAALSATH